MSKLRQLRNHQGKTRKFVAKGLGVTPDHLSNIERGSTPLNLIQIKKLAQIYNVSFSEMAEIALITFERRELDD
ncbi:helix-turn-helix domain-containing protein [Clostridium beijerinckii]|uniref:Transcriptional regulator with XRE-family HTH domain n=1 Tax=Clostridium beijerinckii TaxID=1520 RepID=A0A9Q5CV83_CLOBE|nr:helix-turn-helix transcriptional regulator [Clostridium beijerinckii]AQS04756.1 anaerobic benzoate catabolism transcriptional regulator [Clostridium beijerinckii]MBA2887567.1 transcriptional regulator with XRE-family HTH domain [Clostridium beijerinckii]MBA2902457.1 transcriptional regulator with XRE-family HTH domain [Clostridium beijerinckii]MBA2912253.1 transcriptional regulator with XRE-family HTH domain [Clostridium beijerinckii]MBA9015685.1 transcriptional regulator with XRE-family HT